jgi:hypothetical protein
LLIGGFVSDLHTHLLILPILGLAFSIIPLGLLSTDSLNLVEYIMRKELNQLIYGKEFFNPGV